MHSEGPVLWLVAATPVRQRFKSVVFPAPLGPRTAGDLASEPGEMSLRRRRAVGGPVRAATGLQHAALVESLTAGARSGGLQCATPHTPHRTDCPAGLLCARTPHTARPLRTRASIAAQSQGSRPRRHQIAHIRWSASPSSARRNAPAPPRPSTPLAKRARSPPRRACPCGSRNSTSRRARKVTSLPRLRIGELRHPFLIG